MEINKIAIVGVSGFVGSRLFELLHTKGTVDIVPIIHSAGNAGRIARFGVSLKQVDLLSPVQIRDALEGCTHVVNCSRGDDVVMTLGLKNLLSESRRAGISRFVHLSSVAVYGDPPPPESKTEDAPTNPDKNSYGWLKLKQDYLVQKAAKEGLPCITLCPPNIIGPYSIYLLDILGALKMGRFALIERGRTVCNTVDVTNLCHAIQQSLSMGSVDGSRVFVTDGEKVLWRDVVDQLKPLFTTMPDVHNITRADLEQSKRKKNVSVWATAKHIVSSDVREALRKDPLLEKSDKFLRGVVAKLGPRLEDSLRLSIEGSAPIPETANRTSYEVRLCRQQLRGVYHSCHKAERELGYKPVVGFNQSMAAFCEWYQDLHGWKTKFGDLIRIADNF